MKILSISIHNFRSIKDCSIQGHDLLVINGENNSGKSNLIAALRILYGDLKYEKSSDFPKFTTEDNESWIEVEYLLQQEDYKLLKKEYQLPNNTMKVRKYFFSEKISSFKITESNIFGYEEGILSENLFYGAKNVSKAKLGELIFIPEVSKSDDNLKLSGPSPLRNILNYVMKKVVKSSGEFQKLEEAFQTFNKAFPIEESNEGLSLDNVRNDINSELGEWGIKFDLNINSVKPDDIVKNLVSTQFKDDNFPDSPISHNNFGQGMQRHLIYSLIKLSAKYKDKVTSKKTDFSPEFQLILFEEPESFLHPTQQGVLNRNLVELSQEEGVQVVITTHSPKFISSNLTNLNRYVRVNKLDGISNLYQATENDINNIFLSNQKLLDHFKRIAESDEGIYLPKTIQTAKRFSGRDLTAEELIDEESVKFLLWLDNERSSMFFAKKVLICEGASEKVLFDYLLCDKWKYMHDKHVYFLDAMGKFNIHRYMNLFKVLGIHHSVLIDTDEGNELQATVNEFIRNNTNEFTETLHKFVTDVEGFLGIEKPERKDLKPASILSKYKNGDISDDKLSKLEEVLCSLL